MIKPDKNEFLISIKKKSFLKKIKLLFKEQYSKNGLILVKQIKTIVNKKRIKYI